MRQGTWPEKKGRSGAAVRTALALLLALGLGLIWQGIRGQRAYEASGFDSEGAYSSIYALGQATEKAWGQEIRPQLEKLTEEDRNALGTAARERLGAAWEELTAGGAEKAGELTAEAGEARMEEKSFRLLYSTFLTGRVRISSSLRKSITRMTGEEGEAFENSLLACAAALGRAGSGENGKETQEAVLPEILREATEGLSREETLDTLFQAYFLRHGAGEEQTAEQINALKKSVRSKEAQAEAYRMIAEKEIGWADQLIIGNSRTVILLGAVMALDALMLFLFMAAERVWRFDVKWLMILGIVDFLVLFQLMPLIYLLVKAFFPEEGFSLETFRRLYTYPLNLDALSNTLIASFATMILGTLIAFPLAWLVGRTNLYGRKFFRSLFVMTYMVPPYVGAMAWLRLLNPNVGTINQMLRGLMGLGDTPGPLNVYSLPGMIWVLTSFYYPYAFITISRAMEKMDPSLEEAGRISGGSPLKTLMRVTLPMMTPSLISGALLVFVASASCYGIPSIIGGPGRIATVTTRITEYVSLGQQGMNDATGLAVFLVVLAVIILMISDLLISRKQYITVSGKSTQPVIVDLRRGRVPATILVSLFAAVVVFVPFLTILTTSFKNNVGESLTAEGNFTLGNWESVFSRTETLGCLKNSLIFAAAAATAGIVIACVMSYLLQRTRIRGRKLPDFLITLGSGTPSVVIALSLIMTMKGNFGINIYNTAYILIIAYMIKYLMMGMRTVTSAMSQIHVSLEECSQISGASWARTMFRITGRLIFPSIAAGWFLIFIPSFYELSMTTLLYSSTTKTIGFQLYEYWSFTSQPMSCAMAFGILLMVAALNFILNKLTKGNFSI